MKGKVLKAVGDINDITCIFFFALLGKLLSFKSKKEIKHFKILKFRVDRIPVSLTFSG